MNAPIVEMLVKSGPVGLAVCWTLLIASLISWVVIINRFFYLNFVSGAVKKFKSEFENLKSLREYKDVPPRLRESYAGILIGNYIMEFNRIAQDLRNKSGESLSFYFEHQTAIAHEKVQTETSKTARRLNWGLHILAIMSSTAPFVGLFGTVWGIMDSFFEIGNKGSASLTVVAPGIAEALITTVAGLVVAIPSVVFYNLFIHKAERIEDDLDDCSELGFAKLKEELLLVIDRKI
ncbi:MAG: MotA/TolQ/ExbB proton channel family protein [Chitinispirillales bacterium]|jgi:biopolymer transport protein TolQ|nr:MotA/TolQ/ExbB proton channel family protein [Chitinispirillales bacterium]